MTELAAVVLAHRDPVHLRRLVAALPGVPVFLHCDAKTSGGVLRDMVEGLPTRVRLVPRLRTSLASWSLVAAELAGVRAALSQTRASHIAVLSGADYPLMSVGALSEELAHWSGQSYLWNVPMPFPVWDTPRHPDGGMWRLRHRFLTWRDQVLYVGDIPLRSPLPRGVPSGLEFRASSQWKIYTRHHAERLFAVLHEHPDLVRFWRTTLVPEETFVSSILGSPSLLGDDAIPVCRANPWYIRWPEGVYHHPHWLTDADFGDLSSARWAPSATPQLASEPSQEPEIGTRKLFARKFATDVDTVVLDRVDAELRA